MINLGKILAEKGFTCYSLSKALNVSPSTVTRWCKDNVIPRIDTLLAVCKILDCTMDDLLVPEDGEVKTAEEPIVSSQDNS